MLQKINEIAQKRTENKMIKLQDDFIRTIDLLKINTRHELWALGDLLGVPRSLIYMYYHSDLEDMSLCDYNKLVELTYNTKHEIIQDAVHKKCLTNWPESEEFEYLIELDKEDKKFLDKVNQNLDNKSKIDMKDASKAKKVFDNDIKDTPKNPLKDKVMSDYDKNVKKAQMELFGDTEMLDNKTLPTLVSYIKKNKWDGEFDSCLLNHRQSVLLFLYRKLQEKTEEFMKKSQNLNRDNINDWNSVYNKAQKHYGKKMKEAENFLKKNGQEKKSKDFNNDIKSIFDFLNNIVSNFDKK